MDEIILKRPSAEDKQAVMGYRAVFLRLGEGLHGTGGLRSEESYEAWLTGILGDEHTETLREERVEATTFMAVRKSDNALIGFIQVRHRLNEHLLLYGGHIGYSVHTSERRKGYATEMLRQALAFARSIGITRALLTCNNDNPASQKTILSQGGVLENTVTEDSGQLVERYWIELGQA